jgi:hypothetical protein
MLLLIRLYKNKVTDFTDPQTGREPVVRTAEISDREYRNIGTGNCKQSAGECILFEIISGT